MRHVLCVFVAAFMLRDTGVGGLRRLTLLERSAPKTWFPRLARLCRFCRLALSRRRSLMVSERLAKLRGWGQTQDRSEYILVPRGGYSG